MPMSAHLKALRAAVGSQVLLLPSVTVLPRDDSGRLLLVRHVDGDAWGTIGGAVELDERPRDAAVREAKEEAGVDLELTRVIDAVGGPAFRVVYANGDPAAYVAIVYEAIVVGGTARPDGVETCEVGWFAPTELHSVALNAFARATFDDILHLL